MNNDLISRSALIDAIEKGEGISWERYGDNEVCVRKKYIDNAPTVDCIEFNRAKELIKQAYQKGKDIRLQGEWIEGENGSIKCNQCGCEIIYSYLIGNKPEFPKFCCDCGAYMGDKEE